jgi:hypothetical protein
MADNVDRLINGALIWNVRRDLIDIRSYLREKISIGEQYRFKEISYQQTMES